MNTIRFIKSSFLLLLIVNLFAFGVLARSGCCSHHGGVAGCQCGDGSPLSDTCRPYYPECNGGGSTIQDTSTSQPSTTAPTNPPPIATSKPLPTAIPKVTPTNTPAPTDTPIPPTDTPKPTAVPTGQVLGTQQEKPDNSGGAFVGGLIIGSAGTWMLGRRKKKQQSIS